MSKQPTAPMCTGVHDMNADKKEEQKMKCVLYALVKYFSATSWKIAKAYATANNRNEASVDDFITALKYNTSQSAHLDKIFKCMTDESQETTSVEWGDEEKQIIQVLYADITHINNEITQGREEEYKSQMLVDVVQEASTCDFSELNTELSTFKKELEDAEKKWKTFVPNSDLENLIYSVIVSLEEAEKLNYYSSSSTSEEEDFVVPETRSQKKRRRLEE